MKRIISLLIPLCVAFAMVTAVSFAADADAQDQNADQDFQVQMLNEDPAAGDQEMAVQEAAGWKSEDGGWRYYDEQGNSVKGKFLIGGSYYFFAHDTGLMQTGWVKDNAGMSYYCDPNGSDPTAAGQSFGAMYKGWQSIGSVRYYFDATECYMHTGWLKLGTAKYYLGTNGQLQTGMKTIDGSKYFLDPNKGGCAHVGWLKNYSDGYSYYFNNSGKARTGWLSEGSYKYYFADSGRMKTGWLKVGSDKYYLNTNNGRMVTGKQTIGGSVYYFDTNNGKMKTGFVSIGSAKYYFNTSNGKMQKGWVKVGSSKYYMNTSSGKMVTGMKKVGSSYYYFNTSSGKMTTGALKYKGSLYYFFSSGKRVTSKGWFKGSDKKSRYGLGSGKIATGKKTISGITYKFNSKTGVCEKNLGDTYDQKIANQSSSTGYLISVIKGKYQVRVYKGKKGSWSRVYTFTCAYGTSKPAKGTYTVTSKTAHHDYSSGGNPVHWNNGVNITGSTERPGDGFSGYVWTGKYPDGEISDSRLGGKYTGGRVRLAESNSLWLYNNIPTRTKVIIQ